MRNLPKKWLYIILLAVSVNTLAGMGDAAFLHLPKGQAVSPAEPDTLKPRFSVRRTAPRDDSAAAGRTELGTASYMPPIMGQMIAGEVIRQISGVGCETVRADGTVVR